MWNNMYPDVMIQSAPMDDFQQVWYMIYAMIYSCM